MLQSSQKKKMSTRTLMLITGVITITLGFSITIGLLSWQSGQQQRKLAEDYLGQIAQSQAQAVENELDYARTVARDVGQSMVALPAAGITDRAVGDKLLTYALKQNQNYMSISITFEENAFDGRDAEFAAQPDPAPGGRYARFVDRDAGGNYNLHHLTSIFTPGQGDYYILPKKAQRDMLIEPYSYAYNGVPTLLTSVAAVIVDDGRLKAVATSDISLASLQERVSKITPWEGTGYALLISHGGRVVSSPNKEQAGKPYGGQTDGYSSQI
ncbi:cache domain-containing protein, partial [Erwinia sp. B116]|uniref:PDC sensor domain-containing protein n=1 Tax=Erwinia sp. B116 TaxID=1561024 RepID=UPI000CAD3CCB